MKYDILNYCGDMKTPTNSGQHSQELEHATRCMLMVSSTQNLKLYLKKVLQNSSDMPPSGKRATDNDTPGLVAPHAFCKFSDRGMSELFCNTSLTK